MERLQRNGGTAGIVAAVLLLVLFFLIGSTGVNLMAPGDPAQTLAAFTQKAGSWMPIGLVGALASAVAAIFLAGLSSRLHDKAPTRSRAVLYFGLIGLSAHALGSLIVWLGGANLAAFAAKDQAAAVPAWIAMTSVLAGLSGAGNGFSGASAAIAGWAIVQTGAMKTVVGWVALAAASSTSSGSSSQPPCRCCCSRSCSRSSGWPGEESPCARHRLGSRQVHNSRLAGRALRPV